MFCCKQILLKKESLNELVGIKVENIQLLPNEKIIENIKSNLSDNSIELLRQNYHTSIKYILKYSQQAVN